MNKNVTAILTFISLTAIAHDQTFDYKTDDSDIAPRVTEQLSEVPLELTPDEIEFFTPSNPDQSALEIKTLRLVHGVYTEVQGLSFKQSKPNNADCRYEAELANNYFAITDDRDNYRIVFKAPCDKSVRIKFKTDSDGGQALGIWQVAYTAQTKLQASVGLDFWKNRISFSWPADGDYYSYGQVHITKGYQWDVVGHELGHAIYDQADIGVFGGGQHKIDECYSEALALSEGWASFFSGWLGVALDDPDAKFEYLVPRRAPIRFENVPADVCRGVKNEWRVTSFFWDVIDLNNDGEGSQESFKKVWDALANTRSKNMNTVLLNLERASFDKSLLNLVWGLNF